PTHRGVNVCRGNEFLEPASSLTRDARTYPLKALGLRLGTNKAMMICHDGRPLFPPPPVLGRPFLGAADMPIGCALTFAFRLFASEPLGGRAKTPMPGTRP